MTDTPSTALATTSPGTTIERHQGNAMALDERYVNRIPVIAQELAHSEMCPKDFKGKPHEIAIVGFGLADNGIRLSISTLPQCYVIHGAPGYMAQLQTAMAEMHGIKIRPLRYSDEEAVVEVVLPDGVVREVGFTMSEARKANLTSNQMYSKWPANMLIARATTRAISWYCPAVKLGLAGSADMAEIERADRAAQETGELIDVRAAKRRLLDILLERVIPASDDAEGRATQAKGMAQVLWSSHRLPSGPGASVPLSAFDALVAGLPTLEQQAPPAPAPEQGGSDDDIADAEVLEEEPVTAGDPEPEEVVEAEPGAPRDGDEANGWVFNEADGQWYDAEGRPYTPAEGEEPF